MKEKEEKAKIREKIWNLLEKKKIAFSCKGRIPNFEEAKKTAKLLESLQEWKNAKIIFSSPDSAQKKIRETALKNNKEVIMATPRLKKGYLLIRPEDVKGREKEAATIKGAFKFGKPISRLPKVDLVVMGSVAVDVEGYRLGKGGGYGDKEIAKLKEEKSINEKTPIVTNIHELQLVERLPREKHDTRVNIVVMPKKIIRIK